MQPVKKNKRKSDISVISGKKNIEMFIGSLEEAKKAKPKDVHLKKEASGSKPKEIKGLLRKI